MKENIKIGLIGVIAITLVINTFFMDNSSSRRSTPASQPVSNAAVSPTPSNGLNPLTPSSITPASPATTPGLSESRAKTAMNFADMNHDFGNIQQDSKNTKVFVFTNTGDEPLIIETAKGSCGCTVPKFPKEPIAPGETGEIEVVYSPGKQQGAQNKKITITANTDPVNTVLNISATVEIALEISGQ